MKTFDISKKIDQAAADTIINTINNYNTILTSDKDKRDYNIKLIHDYTLIATEKIIYIKQRVEHNRLELYISTNYNYIDYGRSAVNCLHSLLDND